MEQMNCPVCSVALVMSDRQGVEIDYCPQCRGVWLDRGELDKIIERTSGEVPRGDLSRGGGFPRRGPDNDYRDYDEDRDPRRGRGFFGDLFDFD